MGGDLAVARIWGEIGADQHFLAFLAFPILARGTIPTQVPMTTVRLINPTGRAFYFLLPSKGKDKFIRPISQYSHKIRPSHATPEFLQLERETTSARKSLWIDPGIFLVWTERSTGNLSLSGCTTGRCDKSWLVSKTFSAAAQLCSVLKYVDWNDCNRDGGSAINTNRTGIVRVRVFPTWAAWWARSSGWNQPV